MTHINDRELTAPLARPATSEVRAPILIGLLGSFTVLKIGSPVHVNGGGKSATLLCFLGLGLAQGTGSETLLHMLWPDTELHLAIQSLHSLVYSLHKLLGDALGGAAPIIYRDGFYHLNGDAGVMVDVACFDALADAGDREERAGNLAAAAAAYGQAVNLYRGDLHVPCAGLHGIVERARLSTRHLSLLAHLATSSFGQGDYVTCLQHTRRLLTHDPCREDAHRLVMRCYVRQGERSAALRQYQLCKEILLHEFDAEPELTTKALFEQVRLDPASI